MGKLRFEQSEIYEVKEQQISQGLGQMKTETRKEGVIEPRGYVGQDCILFLLLCCGVAGHTKSKCKNKTLVCSNYYKV